MSAKTDGCGKRLKTLREERGLGLRELSRSAGLAAASLSAVENGRSSPTLATLQSILKALGSDLHEFFSERQSSPDVSPVFSMAAMKTARDRHREYTWLFPRSRGFRFSMLRETIRAGEDKGQWETHDFDMGGLVLAGGPLRLELKGTGVWEVREGESFYIKAGVRHRSSNAGGEPLNLITVADPPRY